MFALGVITGLLIAILIVTTLGYFKKTIQKHTQIIEQKLESKGPQPRGFIVDPDDESTETRNKILEKNKKRGLDTPLTDLQ